MPQAATGCSPFELLYGSHIEGSMSLMRDVWTGEVQEGEGILSYLLNMRYRLAQMSELAQETFITFRFGRGSGMTIMPERGTSVWATKF